MRSRYQPDSVRTERVAAGVHYAYVWSAEGPWAIHLVEADLDRCDLALRTLQAAEREDGGPGRETVSSMAGRQAAGVLAAVNADFFTPEGAALGTEVVAGRLTSARERPALLWRRGEEPWMGATDVDGDSLRGGWTLPLAHRDRPVAGGPTAGVGGYPDLIDDGTRVGDLEMSTNPTFAGSRHPRTAVGWDADDGALWLVVVDGRQTPHSAGMTLPELAELFEALGVEEALNLDGGGSSAMVVRGALRNRPSDEEGEREVVNALAVVRDGSGCSR